MVWVTSKADTSSLDQDGPLEVPLQVNKLTSKYTLIGVVLKYSG